MGFVTVLTKAQSSLKFFVFSEILGRRPHIKLLENFI